MAKLNVSLPPSEVLYALIDGEGRLAVRVTPGAKIESLDVVDGRLQVKVRAKPEDGKANDAVRNLLAKAYGVASSRVELLRGSTSREKQFKIVT